MIKKKIICIDYGIKYSGLSITNGINNIAFGLCNIQTNKLLNYLKKKIIKNNISIIIIGLPKKLNNKNQITTINVYKLKNNLYNLFPNIKINLIDERFTTKLSKYYLNKMNIKKKNIKEKINIMSSILILQSYLNNK
ncbi:MAG: Holliday junction resolvase RuvX [Candidatus Shikimatogenerans bostrichidophilus]|nr:MAG: Holliday junction resolvase RuvX [Candidatus Shikimatogenerans bostrichidophilus]